MHQRYKNLELVIATKHKKEAVLAPVFVSKLGVNCRTIENFDTDQFGTFSGEVERLDSPLEAARKKNRFAHEMTGCALALASEGSFGQHPHLFFVSGNEELLLFSDFENGLEIVEKSIVTETNFAGQCIHSWKEAVAFAEKIGFPESAIILRKSESSHEDIVKGITDPKQFQEAVKNQLKNHQELWLETDMRAHLNPQRMAHIGALGKKLSERILSACPSCQSPGFGPVKNIAGLPCQWCSRPTRSIKTQVWGCVKCDHQEEKKHPNKKEFEDPMYCDFCNP